MEFAADFTNIAQRAVTSPDFTGALLLFWSSLGNELLAILPYMVLLSSQFFLIEEPFSMVSLIKLSLFVFVPISIGAGLGSIPIYVLSYFGGKPMIDKLGKYIRLSWEQVESMKGKFSGSWYDEIIFLLLRTVPFMPSLPVSIAAGIMRMNPAPYFVLTIAGSILRIVIMFAFIAIGAEGIEELAH